MIKKLRIKFICVNLLFVTCMLAILFGTLTYFMDRTIAREQTAELHRLAVEPEKKVRPNGGNTGEEYVMSHFTLEYTPDGRLKAFGSGGFDLSDEKELSALYARVMAEEKADGVLKDYGLRYHRATTPFGQKAVFADMHAERATVRYLVRSCALLALVSFAVFFAASLLLSKRVVRPVERAWEQQKQFVVDASHELKTPLTVIISNAELLQQPNHDDAEKRRFSENIHEMSRQMRRLVESLLDLARLDSAQEPPQTAELDFSTLCEEAALPFEAVYFERGLLLETEIDPGIRVQGVEQSLRQVVDILLDNAQKYSLPGTVTLTLRQTNHNCILTVSNPSPELSREECRNIFKRFYRIDESRTRSGSYGLGLPIAESIVTRFGGKIVCEYAEGEAHFTVTLPTVCGK